MRSRTAFAALGPGEIGLVVDSYGLLALCLDQRSAADELQIAASSEVSPRVLADDGEGPQGTPVAFTR